MNKRLLTGGYHSEGCIMEIKPESKLDDGGLQL